MTFVRFQRFVGKCRCFAMCANSPIARGAFSVVYPFNAANEKTAVKFIAAKHNRVEKAKVLVEITILWHLVAELGTGEVRFPPIIEYGRVEDCLYTITPLKGPSLTAILKEEKLDFKAKVGICYQTCYTIRGLQNMGYCHGDIKPGHFLTQHNCDAPFLTIIDFGLTRRFRSPRPSDRLMGTPKYASIAAHYRRPTGQCDDFQSWLMMCFEMFSPLPWAEEQDLDKMRDLKKQWHFEKCLPDQYAALADAFSRLKETFWHASHQDEIESANFLAIIQSAGVACGATDITGPWLPAEKKAGSKKPETTPK
uniref:Protein kinase domain-containing protein n=1 Tax=Bursaphelenchus xylophilus TaxID=6326 RepID=A0A1I7SFJ1_BURXY